jgi:hypothetical protein
MVRADFPPFMRGFGRAFTPFTSYSGIRYRVIHVIEDDKSYVCTHVDRSMSVQRLAARCRYSVQAIANTEAYASYRGQTL